MTEYLIIDCHALCHRARYAMKGKELSHEDERTEVIFNFMKQIQSIVDELECNNLIFVWDSRKNNRNKIFKSYKRKAKVEKQPDDIRFDNLTLPQFQRIRREVLPAMGFKNIFIQTGMEADDIIASIIQTSDPEKYSFTIVSQDQDLFQLLEHYYCEIYNYQTKKTTTRQTFEEEYNIIPARWWEAKAIAGCRSDRVPGVEMVGEKTAIKYLNGELNKNTKAYKNIENSKDVIKRNKLLVKLPLPDVRHFKIVDDEITTKKFINVFESLDFRVFLRPEEFKIWEEIFDL